MRNPQSVVNVLSVDVEDYFQVETLRPVVAPQDWPGFHSRIERNTFRLLDLLAECNVRATFFVLGWTADRYRELVRAIDQAGHELASHGYSHQLIYDQDRQAFRDDVGRGKDAIEQAVGKPVVGYRAPTFSIVQSTLWALDIL